MGFVFFLINNYCQSHACIMCGPKSRYGHKMKAATSTKQGQDTLWAKPLTKSQAKKSRLSCFQSQTKQGSGASLEREWTTDGRFDFTIAGLPFDVHGRPTEEVLCIQFWRDDKLSMDDYLGGACCPLADLESDYNGAIFSWMAFRVKLMGGKGEPLLDDASGKAVTVNFKAEFVPDIEFSYA